MSDHSDHSTLIEPPPIDEKKSQIENVLEITQLSDLGEDVYTNTRPLWHPPGARGIYGGAVIAQCLSAAQRTVRTNFFAHSMHCYFVLAGRSDIPVIYHVERVRDGRSFATRTVQARQQGKCIFTTTVSFVLENSAGKKMVSHATEMPKGVPEPVHNWEEAEFPEHLLGPYESQFLDMVNPDATNPTHKRTRQWIKVRGRITDEGGHQEHLSALAYMTDSYLLGTIGRVHDLWRPWRMPKTVEQLTKEDEERRERAKLGPNAEIQADKLNQLPLDPNDPDLLRKLAKRWLAPKNQGGKPEIGMMVSLDHTIYFHNPRHFRADEWIFTDAQSPWADDGRGLVIQHMFTKSGVLIATCIQEGLVRLKQEESKL